MTDLFDELKRLQLELHQTNDQNALRGVIRFPPEVHMEGSRRIFQNLENGGFSTFVVPRKDGWNPESPYFKEARIAAQKPNISITRLIILPHLHYMRDQTLFRHWDLDRLAGINVQFSVLGKEILELLELLSLTEGTIDFGLWDDTIVSWYVGPNSFSDEPSQWIISNREPDIELGKQIKNLLISQDLLNFNPSQAQAEFALTEPLLHSAPMSDMLADFLCEGSQVDQNNCTWYHKAWQYFRILDLVSTPSWHSEFYLKDMVKDIECDKQLNILICGTADYSMLAYVLEAFSKTTNFFQITVLDLCQTPLHLCKWYAATKNIHINIEQCSILEYEKENEFDYIVTDAFLTRFDDKTKNLIVKKWYGLLKIGGRIVTTIRIMENKIDKPIKATNEERDNFAETAFNLAVVWRDFVQQKPEYIKKLALEYASNIESFSLDWQSAISLFKSNEFKIEMADRNDVKGEMKSTTYLELIANK